SPVAEVWAGGDAACSASAAPTDMLAITTRIAACGRIRSVRRTVELTSLMQVHLSALGNSGQAESPAPLCIPRWHKGEAWEEIPARRHGETWEGSRGQAST